MGSFGSSLIFRSLGSGSFRSSQGFLGGSLRGLSGSLGFLGGGDRFVKQILQVALDVELDCRGDGQHTVGGIEGNFIVALDDRHPGKRMGFGVEARA